MGKLWIPGGGSGAGSGSDECTASKSEVLKGYSAVTSDSDDEPVQGTLELTADASDGQVLTGKTYYNTDPKKKRTGSMANQGAVSVKLNAGEGYTIPSGFHNGGGKVETNGLASQTPGNATSAHILSGQTAWVNGTKINGAIPWQNAEIAGTDRAWATNMSNWAGTINLGIRNGHYINGVNWIQQGIPEYQPWNIKKGVNIGGVVGTFEGYVPGPTDLYLRGNNIIGWDFIDSNRPVFDSGQITITNNGVKYITGPFNIAGFGRLNFVGYMKSDSSIKKTITLYRDDSMQTLASLMLTGTNAGDYTVSIDVSNFQINSRFVLSFVGMTGAIYRIWLS